MEWQLQDAKARLSELVKKAITQGPQNISVRGKRSVVVIGINDYDRLTQQNLSFVDFIRKSPLVGINLDLQRRKSSHHLARILECIK